MVIPEEDDTWMLDIDQDDALLLAAACDSNGEHDMHAKYDYVIHEMICDQVPSKENLLKAEEPSEKKPKLEKVDGEASSSSAKCFK